MSGIIWPTLSLFILAHYLYIKKQNKIINLISKMCAIVTNEDWKFVKGYENIYQVSNFGRIRSFTRTVDRKNGATYYAKGQTLRPILRKSGFAVALYKDLADGTKFRKEYQVSHLVIETFGDEIGKRFVLHKDGNKLNNRADNLYYSDTKDGGEKNTPKDKDLIFDKELNRAYKLTEDGYIPVAIRTKEG